MRSGTRTTRSAWKSCLLHAALLMACLAMLYPLLWMLRGSVAPTTEIFQTSPVIPSSISFESFRTGWEANSPGMGRFLINSFIVCFFCVVGNIVACTLAAYAFARLRFPLKTVWFSIMLMTVMLPGHVTLIPQYGIFYQLGWVNTYLPLIVPKFLATDAFFIFLLTQFIRTIPTELDEAAEIDGCSRWGIFRRIILPLITPALATTAVFTFIWTYEDFLTPLIYLGDLNKYTVPLGLRMFMNAMGQSSYGQLFAMSLVSLIPIFLIFIFFQRQLVEGIATTGMKG